MLNAFIPPMTSTFYRVAKLHKLTGYEQKTRVNFACFWGK
jgi:hypothetical protein